MDSNRDILQRLTSLEALIRELHPQVKEPKGVSAMIRVVSMLEHDTDCIELAVRTKGNPEALGVELQRQISAAKSLGMNTVYEVGSALSVSLDPIYTATLTPIRYPSYWYTLSLGAGGICEMEVLEQQDHDNTYSVYFTGDINRFFS